MNKREMRMKQNLEIGYYHDDGATIVCAAEVDYSDGDVVFALAYHKGEMPAHDSKEFGSADDLLTAMAAIAPLADWRVRES
jgi:hypothetical protein